MDMHIHGVRGVSVFRMAGLLKISIIDEKNAVHEISLHGHEDKTPLMRDSNDRVPYSPQEFGLEVK